MCARDCPDSCFLDVTVKDGVILEVVASSENQVTRGLTCPRARGDPERVASARRVKYPFIRDPSKGAQYHQVNWEEALDLVAFRLKQVLNNGGPEKVLLLDYAGNTGFITTVFTRRLWNIIGATKTDHAVCSASGHAALNLHYGLSYGCKPEQLPDKKVIVFWGFNAKVSSPHQWALATRARRFNGASIVSVDPRMSETSELSDLWLNPVPGSDVALAYGLANWLIKNDKVDLGFIEKWSSGYKVYKEEAMKWGPGKVEKLTGVKRERVEELGSLLASNSPAVFMIGIGLNKSAVGAESVRAVSLLPALLGLHRGFYYSNSRGRYIGDLSLSNKITGSKIVSQVSLGERLQSGEYKFVYVSCMNPVLTLPDSKKVVAGFKREDVFVVVHDTHITETCRCADVVLPAPTYLEKDDVIVSDSHSYVRVSSAAVPPQYGSRDEVWVMKKLAEKIGVKDKRVFSDPWKEMEKAFKEAFIEGSFQDLLNGETLILRNKEADEYQTPSGRVEFSSQAAFPQHHPLPIQHHYMESVEGFTMLNSALPEWTHTQFKDVYGDIPSLAWINPANAEKLGIRDREEITLYNHIGKIRATACVTEKIGEGVIWTPRELVDASGNIQNSLTPGTPQKIGGGPFFNSVKVMISKG